MSFSEIVNRNSKYAVALVIVAIIVAVIVTVRQMSGGSPAGPASAVVFTVDEKTWFTDDPKKLVPFDKDGKEAVRAHVFKCEDGTTFIGYMERNTKSAKALREKFKADPNSLTNDEKGQYMSLSMTGTEIKKPGDKQWVHPTGGPLNIKCADGKLAAEVRE